MLQSDDVESKEMQLADKRAQMLAAVIVGAGLAFAATALIVFKIWLESLQQMSFFHANDAIITAFRWLGTIACPMVLVVAIFLYRLGSRVRSLGQYPLPGMRVLRDTPILRAEAAQSRGKTFQVLGIALALFAIALLTASWRPYPLFPKNDGLEPTRWRILSRGAHPRAAETPHRVGQWLVVI